MHNEGSLSIQLAGISMETTMHIASGSRCILIMNFSTFFFPTLLVLFFSLDSSGSTFFLTNYEIYPRATLDQEKKKMEITRNVHHNKAVFNQDSTSCF